MSVYETTTEVDTRPRKVAPGPTEEAEAGVPHNSGAVAALREHHTAMRGLQHTP